MTLMTLVTILTLMTWWWLWYHSVTTLFLFSFFSFPSYFSFSSFSSSCRSAPLEFLQLFLNKCHFWMMGMWMQKCTSFPMVSALKAIDDGGVVGANSVNNGGLGKWTSHATPADLSTLLITKTYFSIKKLAPTPFEPVSQSLRQRLPIKYMFVCCPWSPIVFCPLDIRVSCASFIVAIWFDGIQLKICEAGSLLWNIFYTLSK